MSDIKGLRTFLYNELNAEHQVALATLVRKEGSSYRKPGAKMLVSESGASAGLLSGGCLEADIAQKAKEVLGSQHPAILSFDLRREDDALLGWGLGCQGKLDILVEPILPPVQGKARETVERYLGASRSATMIPRVVRREGEVWGSGTTSLRALSEYFNMTAVDHSCSEETEVIPGSCEKLRLGKDVVEVFWDLCPAEPLLYIFGAGPDAESVYSLAATLGWSVHIKDHRPAYLDSRRFPHADTLELMDPENPDVGAIPQGAAAVVMTHNFYVDAAVIENLLCLSPSYVGLLGPTRRRERVFEHVRTEVGDPSLRFAGVFGPAGLDLGAETPAEIALSIVSEIQKVRTKGTGVSLHWQNSKDARREGLEKAHDAVAPS